MIFKRIVKRKWGWYWTILDRKHFKVKLLRFKKGEQLSLQWHQCRNELWLFLKGSGIISDNWDYYRSSTFTYMKSGSARNIFSMERHTYFAETVTWVLEIQYGDKCVEDDIVRI